MQRRRGRVRLLVALTLAAVLLAAAPAGAARDDARTRRKQLREKRAAQAAKINALRATDAEVGRALDVLDDHVKKQATAVQRARTEQVKADLRLIDASLQERVTEQKLRALRESVRVAAVRAYVRGPNEGMGAVFRADSLREASRRQAYFDVAVGRRGEALDELRASREDLGVRRAAAEAARKRASTQRAKVEGRLADLKFAEAEKERIADAVEDRLDAALAEANALAGLDAQLSAELARQQERLVNRLQNGPVRVGSGRTVRGGSVTVTNVGGITVNVQIASKLAALLTAAAADGVVLGGGGYRDPSQQVALRRAHCGTSNAAIYSMPPSRCRPPTARPGASMHERGLAVDFTSGGRVIRGRSSPAFQWLNKNARRFGFFNLRSEPWHWSTNGN